MISTSKEPYLLVWRGWLDLTPSAELLLPRNQCKYCKAPISRKGMDGRCRLCGWGYDVELFETTETEYNLLEEQAQTRERILRAFRISSTRIALAELGTHLKKHFSDVYSLSPLRFEELIGDVFGQIGYRVEMTKKSHDGGVDLFLLSGNGDRIGIVQCKRYRKNRKIDISMVSQLLGTQLAFDVKKAIFVTTSEYTQPAIQRAYAPGIRKHGFAVDLLDAADVLRMLQIYNEELPPLDKLDNAFLHSRGLVLYK